MTVQAYEYDIVCGRLEQLKSELPIWLDAGWSLVGGAVPVNPPSASAGTIDAAEFAGMKGIIWAQTVMRINREAHYFPTMKLVDASDFMRVIGEE